MPTVARIEPKRIRSLRLELARAVPRFPNNRETLKQLEEKSLGNILVDYLNWARRYVTPRQRKVFVTETARRDRRFEIYRTEIRTILDKAETGEDLTPYLSGKIQTRGYSPDAGIPGLGADRWCDKDFVLNVMGLHHFHLDAMPYEDQRSNDMLFAEVTRTTFTLVGIFNHDVFTPPPFWSQEKERLWQTFEMRVGAGAPAGSVVALTPVATSGHSLETTYRAMGYANKIVALDHLIDDRSFVQKIYMDAKQETPKRSKLKWAAWSQDIGIYDASTRGFFAVCTGPN